MENMMQVSHRETESLKPANLPATLIAGKCEGLKTSRPGSGRAEGMQEQGMENNCVAHSDAIDVGQHGVLEALHLVF